MKLVCDKIDYNVLESKRFRYEMYMNGLKVSRDLYKINSLGSNLLFIYGDIDLNSWIKIIDKLEKNGIIVLFVIFDSNVVLIHDFKNMLKNYNVSTNVLINFSVIFNKVYFMLLLLLMKVYMGFFYCFKNKNNLVIDKK